MAERQLEFLIGQQDSFELTDPEWGLPPEPERWPTAEQFRRAALDEPDPRIALKELRRNVPLAGGKTLGIVIRAV